MQRCAARVAVCRVLAIAAGSPLIISADTGLAAEDGRAGVLEQVIITAQKREQSLQEAPLAVSALTDVELETRRIRGLDGLQDGTVPSLRIEPFGSTPSTLVIAIRGNGPSDIGQVTRESSVAVYVDGFYLGRAQGLSMDHADLERIEVLRGPQGTFFGRNATGGAINMVSKKPTGEFGLEQTISYGRFDEILSVTHLDLPEFSSFSVKVDYVHHERDGWVENLAPDQADYFAFNKDTARVTLNWQPTDSLEFNYSFDYADVSATQIYHQLSEDNVGLIGVESGRARQTRFPIIPLEPTVTEHRMHALTASWNISENLTLKSLTSFRGLDEDVSNNFAGTLYFNGVMVTEDIEQDQFSQELQLIGNADRIEWIVGLYYYDEDVVEITQNLFSLDIFGIITGTPLTPIIPPTNFDALVTGAISPPLVGRAEAKSRAIYGQATWTPPVLDDRLHLTLGLRYTDDKRNGSRTILETTPFDLETDNFDPAITIAFDWTDGLMTYAKWSTAYKAGGVGLRSASFTPFLEEEVETFEIGIKSEFWGRRARLNAAFFLTDIKGTQIDILDPINPTVIESINAANTAEIDGLEIDLTVTPTPGLVFGLSYTYLNGRMPLQPNPLADGAPTVFNLAQTPEHAGSLSVAYTFEPMSFGTLIAHFDMTATDEYFFQNFGTNRFDSYALLNARLTLTEIGLGNDKNRLTLSVWGKNLTDNEYLVFGFSVGTPPAAITQVFGTPRTFGFDASLEF